MDILGVQLGPTELWLLAGIGALLAWFIPHRLAVSREVQAHRRVAREAISVAFLPELNAIRQGNDDIGRFILTDAAFRKHEAAVLTQSSKLGLIERMRLKSAWRRFAFVSGSSAGFYAQYADAGSLEKRRKIKLLAVARLEKIIRIIS